ncbi:MAG TPA: hypothetical protein VMH24_03940 [Candidatus Sulfotelmatobacter sp.]|nr:hypothetical protein [Candidatus Sulfotelmatobacter sp.]
MAVAAGTSAEAAQVHITSAVDANWRGSYDILVRPPGSRLDLEQTNGLVEPDFLGFAGAGGMSLAQLAAIRAVPGVALAAPVAVVGYMSYTDWAPSWQTTEAPAAPTLYRVDLSMTTSDGLHTVVLQHQSQEVVLSRPTDEDHFFDAVAGQGGCCDGGFNADGSLANLEGLFTPVPAIVSPIIAVDPVAEQALLGPTSAFLGSFGRLPTKRPLTVDDFDSSLIPADLPRALDNYQQASSFAGQRPVVPLVVSSRLYAPLTLSLSVTQLGHPFATMPSTSDGDTSRILAQAQQAAGPGERSLGSRIYDLTDSLVPFTPPPAALLWPGSGPAVDQAELLQVPSLTQVELASRPTYTSGAPLAGGSTPLFTIASQGETDPSGNTLRGPAPSNAPQASGSAPPTGIGVVTGVLPAYRTFTSRPLATGVVPLANAEDQPFFMLPIGRFDLGQLHVPTNPLTYVPLGAYDPPDTVLIAAPDGTPLSQARPLTSTVAPTGLIEVPPLAITDLASAVLLRGPAPLDAIRVRVAGLSGYTAAGRAAVERVASAIAAMGLDVDVVAGSSPQPVDIYVPSYDTSQQPPTALGYVSQGWTTLGAATRVESALSSANLALLGLGLVLAFVFLLAIEVTAAVTRTREAAILAAIGRPRRVVWRWLVSGPITAGIAIAGATVAAWWITGGSALGLIVGIVLGVALPVAASLGALVSIAHADIDAAAAGDVTERAPRRGPFAVVGPTSYAVRAVVARPVRSAMVIAALAVFGAATGLGATVVGDVLQRAGPTRLATALASELAPSELALLGMTVLGGLLLTVLLMRRDAIDRTEEVVVLATVGWTSGQRRRIGVTQRAVLAVPAALLATALVVPLAAPIAAAPAFLPLTVALITNLTVVLWGEAALIRRVRIS